MKKLFKCLDKIMCSVWVMSIGLICIPFWLYSQQNNKFVYWSLASFLYLIIIIDFLKAVIKKLENYNHKG